MPSAEHLSSYLEILQLILLTLLAVRLGVTGLWRTFPVFFTYVSIQIPNGIVPLAIDVRSNTYLHIWLVTETIFFVLHILLVAELCRLILASHPGILTLGKWAMYASVLIAVVASILSLLPHIHPNTPWQSTWGRSYLAVERGEDFGLGIFLLLLLGFLSRFPMRLNRNVLIHSALYVLYFFSQSLGFFVRTLFGYSQAEGEFLNLLMTALSCVCLAAWLFLLSPEGQARKAAFPTYSAERETRILQQLDALNTTLMRAGGRK